MKKRWLWVATATLLALLAALLLRSGVSPVRAPSSAPDAMAGFVARHWPEALPAQGDPPPGFSALEASLGPQACGQCHATQYADWQSSLHSRTMGPGLGWQLHVMGQQSANACLRCHAPLAEQKSLVALEQRWANAPGTPPPAYVPTDLHRQGLVCAACHVRRHVRFGPPPRTGVARGASTPQPHAGFQVEDGFQDSRFCAVCHQFAGDGARLNGKLIENTYEEWRASAAAAAGKTCQSCHMPERRHLWRGIHDADMVRQALRIELHVEPDAAGGLHARAELSNVGAGHHLPTYLIARIVATLELLDPAGRVDSELARHVIGRQANLQLTQEIADTRLPAGERVSFGSRLARPTGAGWSVQLRIVVDPGWHYGQLFRSVLERPVQPPEPAATLLREALSRIEAGRFELHRQREPL